MTTRQDYIDQARLWLGTPFRWQADYRGLGCDCKGLITGVARELGLPEADHPHFKKADYSPRVDPDFLKRALSETLSPVDNPLPGDVLLLILGGKPQHMGIIGGSTLIHCYVGKTVSEHRLDSAIRLWPIHSAWRFRSLTNGD
jgi:NlpC/P60 family putative phage cell wall peptidase